MNPIVVGIAVAWAGGFAAAIALMLALGVRRGS